VNEEPIVIDSKASTPEAYKIEASEANEASVVQVHLEEVCMVVGLWIVMDGLMGIVR
jgi:hypothetical protein